MHNNYDYPLGADNSSAPWNEKQEKEKEIEVTAYLTFKRELIVEVPESEANNLSVIKEAVADRIHLSDCIETNSENDWYMENFEVGIN